MDHNREDLVNSARVRCPRCGYDQRGVLATWADSCPLQGVCPECGLQFCWGDLLNPALYRPKWSVEFSDPGWRFYRACITTLAMMLLPWQYWADLKMTQEIRWIRIRALLVCVLFIPIALGLIGNAVVTGRVWKSFQFNVVQLMPWGGAGATVTYVTNVMPAEAAIWALFLPLSESSTGTINATTTAPSAIVWNRRGVGTGAAQAGQLPPPILTTFPYPDPLTQLEAIYGESSGLRAPNVWPGGSGLGTLTANWTVPAATTNRQQIALGSIFAPHGTVLLFAPILALLCAAGFAVMPQSRRDAKVRWAHIMRICLYSLVVVAIPLTLAILVPQISFLVGRPGGVSREHMVFVGVIVAPLLLFVWWGFATSCYLRMKHAAGIALAVVIMAWFASATIFFYSELIIRSRTFFLPDYS